MRNIGLAILIVLGAVGAWSFMKSDLSGTSEDSPRTLSEFSRNGGWARYGVARLVNEPLIDAPEKERGYFHLPLRTLQQNLIRSSRKDMGVFSTPVAIHQIKPGVFLIADYKSVYKFDSTDGELTKLEIVISGFETKFVPTAFASHPDGRIFLANYLGNNVLQGEIDESESKLVFNKQIGDSRTLSPEGVDVFESYLAVANYDGGNVQLFAEGPGGELKKYCELPIPYAHGVAFADSHLFVSGLQERKIFKIDYRTCEVVAMISTMGWTAGRLMWPTGISKFDDRSILVSDAHTGLLLVFDTRTMALKRTYGGNGPGKNGLNMPYTAILANGDIWVTSTFGRRLFRIDANSGKSKTWDIDESNRWVFEAPESSFLNRHLYKGYERLDGDFYVNGRCFRPSYTKIVSCTNLLERKVSNNTIKDALQTSKSFEVPISLPYISYFVQISKVGSKFLMSSPQSPVAYLFSDPAEEGEPIEVGFDRWVIYGRLYGPSGSVDLAKSRR